MLSTGSQGLELAAKTDIGMRRANNQDSYAVVLASDDMHWCQRGHVLMVADGMGAHAAGELASKLAADNIPHTYHKLLDRAPPSALIRAISDANRIIHNRGQASADFEGMGTTCTTLLLLPQGALVGHVGDSRVYRLRDHQLEQLSFDHSLVWEMIAQGLIDRDGDSEAVPKNVITRSLGPNPAVKVDLEGPFPIKQGDIYLLCSDGLSGLVSDEEIGAILGANAPEDAVETLVGLANLRGGPDNITVVAAHITGPLISEASLQRCAVELADKGQIRTPRREVNPLIWVGLGVCVLAAGFFAVMSQLLAAGVALAGAMAAGIVAIIQTFDDGGRRHPLGSLGGPYGKAPHREYDCRPRPEITSRLAETVDKLISATGNGQMNIDHQELARLRDAGQDAVRRENYDEAIAEFSRAIRFVVSEMRAARGKHA